MQQRVEDLEKDVDWLEQALTNQSKAPPLLTGQLLFDQKSVETQLFRSLDGTSRDQLIQSRSVGLR